MTAQKQEREAEHQAEMERRAAEQNAKIKVGIEASKNAGKTH